MAPATPDTWWTMTQRTQRASGPELQVDRIIVGGGRRFTLIAGPCAIESQALCLEVAERVGEICEKLGIPYIFKASFDKANRTSLSSFRGPGLDRGLKVLEAVSGGLGIPVTTDIHLPSQAPPVAEVVDLLQIPAFLCRQTDLLVAAAQTGRPVNVKKGQFLAPGAMAHAVEKLRASGDGGVMLTERGSSFGRGDLVADLRGLAEMRALGVPVCMDATHAAQKPGVDGTTGGDRQVAELLARAAVAVGVDALFLEVHPAPERALSDGPNMVALERLPALLAMLRDLDDVVKER